MAPDGDAVPERCPDCGGPMVAYTLRGADAGVCEGCGYVGIDADHTADRPERESWDDALARFYAEFGADGSGDAGDGDGGTSGDGDPGSDGSGDVDGSDGPADADGSDDASDGSGDAGDGNGRGG